MELFRDANIDWLGKKWYFLGFSLIFSVAGVLSMMFWHGIPLGVDFKGGTQITCAVRSAQPNEDHIRQALEQAWREGLRRSQRISAVASGRSGEQGGDLAAAVDARLTQRTMRDVNAVENALNDELSRLRHWHVEQVEIVGPTAGKQLQKQAWLATLYSLIGHADLPVVPV